LLDLFLGSIKVLFINSLLLLRRSSLTMQRSRRLEFLILRLLLLVWETLFSICYYFDDEFPLGVVRSVFCLLRIGDCMLMRPAALKMEFYLD
jgi:hypothetical protein